MPTDFGCVEFKAVDWHTSYAAEIALNGNCLADESGFPNRLAAQRRAEVLGREICETVLLQVYGIKMTRNIVSIAGTDHIAMRA